jgi:hypothetical protein
LARFPKGRLAAALPVFVSALVSLTAVIFFQARGWLLYFGDAEAHLNIARRLVDNRTPGLEQLGVPWLPLPHLLTAPFAAIDALWFDGLAGAIPAALCFAAAGVFLFYTIVEVFGSRIPAWIGLLAFLSNPNALYLQSTAMTEPVFAFCLCGLLYFTVRFRRTHHLRDAAAAGIFATLGTLTRYESWFLLPFCALYFLLTASDKWRVTAVFCAIAGVGPILWLFYNWWLTGNMLEFQNGPGSAKAIQGNASYPGLHDWGLAWLYLRTCIRLVLGTPLYWIVPIGAIAALMKRQWWPVLLLALPVSFYLWSMHSAATPIFIPELWPHSWYNARYGIVALPLAAFCGAAITRTRLGLLLVMIAVFPWIRHPDPERWIAWKESERNSVSRRAWTSQSAAYLRTHVDPADSIMSDFDDTMGIYRNAHIPLRRVFHSGNTLFWEAAVQHPDFFMNTGWVVCQRRDSSRLSAAMQRASHYHLVHTVTVSNAPPVDFYKHDDPFYKGARRAQRLPPHVDERRPARN